MPRPGERLALGVDCPSSPMVDGVGPWANPATAMGLWPGSCLEPHVPRHSAVLDYRPASPHLDGGALVGQCSDRRLCLGIYYPAGGRHLWGVGLTRPLGSRPLDPLHAPTTAVRHCPLVQLGDPAQLGAAPLAHPGLHPKPRQRLDAPYRSTVRPHGHHRCCGIDQWLLGRCLVCLSDPASRFDGQYSSSPIFPQAG
jgi:hypothetical protein